MDISGKEIAKKIKDKIKQEVANLEKKPGLAVVIVGENPASKIYVKHKERACEYVGFYSEKIELRVETTEQELLELVEKLNKDDKIHGILVQLPLPEHIDEDKVISSISLEKDVDGFHPISMGNLFIGKKGFIPCTPKGIMKLIESTGVDIQGKDAVVIGRSNIVGKPVAMLLMQKNATITICHSRTQNIKEISRKADILVVAIGRANFVSEDMVKEGAVVIDVGINRLENGKLAGDVDYNKVKDKASFITPVPGGVGPMTIAMLMQNTLDSYNSIEKTE